MSLPLRKKCIWSYYGPHSVRMQENTDQNNSEYGHFSRSVLLVLDITFSYQYFIYLMLEEIP